MDDIVRAALAKWPNVPACYGWLALDARGDFYMRDDRCQVAAPFQQWRQAPQARGSRIEHDKLLAFIHRNYALDEAGQAYFQNGPQRVYVELERAPWVYRIQSHAAQLALYTPEREALVPSALFTCEQGLVYALTTHGFGLLHSLDMVEFAERLEREALALEPVLQSLLPARFGFVQSPQARHKPAQV